MTAMSIVLPFLAAAALLVPQDGATTRPASRPASNPAGNAVPVAQVKEHGTTYDVFGAGVAIPEDKTVAIGDAIKDIDKLGGQTLRIAATVESVCQKKGCWTWIVNPQDATRQRAFVRFKDYGFFLPKDCAGREIVLEGVVKKGELSVKQAKHYAEDAGKPEEARKITAPIPIIDILATGVHLGPATAKAAGKPDADKGEKNEKNEKD